LHSSSGGGGMVAAAKQEHGPAPVLTPQVILHDRANLVALPTIGCMVLAGLLGYMDTLLVRSSWVAA
jgi:hypothetical protein